jgi:hypothetical protein
LGRGLRLEGQYALISQGDWFQTQVNVTQGALRYLFNTPNTNWGVVNGNREASGDLFSEIATVATFLVTSRRWLWPMLARP